MADSQIASLFATPEMYRQAQDQQALARATQFAQLDPLQRAAQSMYYGGYQAGNAIAGALGGQDPQLQQLSAVQSVLKQVNPGDPNSLLEAARKLQGVAPQQAMQLAQQAQTIQAANLKNLETQSVVAKNMREQQTTDQRNYAAAKDGGFKGTFQEWLDRKATLGRNITSINMPAAEKAFDVKLAELDAKTVDDARKMRDTSISAIKSLNQLASLPDNQLIGGAFAEGRVGATNLLATLGLASGADLNKLAKSQQYQKTAGDVVLQTLGGKLGTGFSNEDRKFIVGLVPQLETSPQARRELITFMQNKNQDIVNETLRLEKYAREKKGLSGFDYKIPMSVAPSAASGMTDEQLKAIAGIK